MSSHIYTFFILILALNCTWLIDLANLASVSLLLSLLLLLLLLPCPAFDIRLAADNGKVYKSGTFVKAFVGFTRPKRLSTN